MANVINATSTGSGGLISTGDDSGVLNIQTNETTALSIDASQNVTVTTQAANNNSTRVATTAYADAVRDNPRILSLSNAATSANLSGIDSVVYPGTNGSNATLSTFSNVVTYKLYVFFNTGGSDGVRTLTIDRSNAYLNGSANAVLQANYTQLVIGRSSTTLAGAAPISANG